MFQTTNQKKTAQSIDVTPIKPRKTSPHQQLQWPLVFHLEEIDLKMSPIFFCHKITSTSMKTEKMVSQNHLSTRFN